jgi:hypothetical protein
VGVICVGYGRGFVIVGGKMRRGVGRRRKVQVSIVLREKMFSY